MHSGCFFSFRVQASQEHLWQSPIIIAYMYMKKKSWFYFSSANSSIAGLSFVVNLRGEHKATYKIRIDQEVVARRRQMKQYNRTRRRLVVS